MLLIQLYAMLDQMISDMLHDAADAYLMIYGLFRLLDFFHYAPEYSYHHVIDISLRP